MQYLIVGALVVAALVVVAYLNRAKLGFGKSEGSPLDAAPAVPPAAIAQAPAATAGPDYAKWGGYTPYQLQTMVGRLEGPFPHGIPVEWDWKEWARVNGKVDPTAVPDTGGPVDRSGSDLGRGGGNVLVRGYAAGQPQSFTFVADEASASYRFAVMGAPGRVFRTASSSIDGGPYEDHVGLIDAIREARGLSAGPHTIAIVVDRDSQNGVQYTQA